MTENVSLPTHTFSSEVEQGSRDSKYIWGKRSIIYLYNISQVNFTVKKDTKQKTNGVT